jgi:hypothetical protein
MSFIDVLVEYHALRSFSPEIFARHLSIQLLGHAMGWKSFNRTYPPRGLIHNSYIALLGQSGKSKKTTAQDNICNLIPTQYLGSSLFSPEGLLQEMSDLNNGKENNPGRSQLICPMGEFSTVLRSIKNGGNMSNFKEISNDLYSQRREYTKKLVNREYHVDFPYLSLNTTCTEEEFYANLTPDMVHGGFLPRFLLVKSDNPVRRRIVLPDNIATIEDNLKCIIKLLYQILNEKPLKLEFDQEADTMIYDIQSELEDKQEYETIQPFVARYVDYIGKYADILFLADKISDITGFTHITEIIDITDITRISKVMSDVRLRIVDNSVNSVNSLFVQKAMELIEPCLLYANKVVNYVDEEKDMAIVLKILEGKNEMDRSELLHRSHLYTDELERVLETLYERTEYKPEIISVGEGQAKKKKLIIKRVTQ